MKIILFSLILFLCFGISIYAEDSARGSRLTVAAAANLQSVLGELQRTFEKDSGVKLKTVIGSSGKLTAQIENGAPFDVFLSADVKYPETLYKEGLSSQPPKVYAYGILVLWSTKDLDLSQGILILKDARVKKIALANPQVAPYGRESVNAMEYYKLYQDVNKKFVYGESIGQVNDFIVSQSADIGFTSKSTVVSPQLKEKGVWLEIPAKAYQRLAQGGIILQHGEKNTPGAVKKFYNFLFSPEAKAIFKKYGYAADE